jgi:hypothetical protein
MLKNSFLHVFLGLAFLSFLLSCKKPEDEPKTILPPPDIRASSISAYVAANIDSLPLLSDPIFPAASPGNDYAQEWETRWVCEEKPAGSATPLIMGSDQVNAYVNGLVPGEYLFRVTYSTIAGQKSAVVYFSVVKDIPAGTIVERSDLNWRVDQDLLGGTAEALTEWIFDPEHVFYRGMNRFPRIEYQPPNTNAWIQLDLIYKEKETSTKNYAFYRMLDATIYFNVKLGLGQNWQSTNPKVRLIY